MTRGPDKSGEYAEALRVRYWRATKKQKGKILDEFAQVTGHHRKEANRVLLDFLPGFNAHFAVPPAQPGSSPTTPLAGFIKRPCSWHLIRR